MTTKFVQLLSQVLVSYVSGRDPVFEGHVCLELSCLAHAGSKCLHRWCCSVVVLPVVLFLVVSHIQGVSMWWLVPAPGACCVVTHRHCSMSSSAALLQPAHRAACWCRPPACTFQCIKDPCCSPGSTPCGCLEPSSSTTWSTATH